MGSPFRSALAKLDDSVQNLEHQLGCLRGGLDVGDDQLWQALNDSHQSAAALREMVRAERPDADWSDRATLEILIQHLESPAMWSIFQLQDLLGMDEKLRRRNVNDERINVPANPKNYWRYRMHLTLEKLIQANEFNDELREYVQESGR